MGGFTLCAPVRRVDPVATGPIRRRLAPIEYRCTAHVLVSGFGTLSHFRRRWAFCPSATGRGHRWIPTSPTSIVRIRSAVAQR
jgi:hypothetical protein